MTGFAPPPSSEDAPRLLRESLAREVVELDARIAEMATLDEERAAVAREIEEVGAAAQDERRRMLPLLGEVRSAGGCGVAFDRMTGEGRVRTCARCRATVVDARRLDARRVRALLGREDGPLFARPDGTVMSSPCRRAARRRALTKLAGVALTIGVALVASAALERATTPSPTLSYLSPRSDLGHRPRDIPHQRPVAHWPR